MAIQWTPNLSVGVDHIDDQHKIWFEKANDLFEAGKNRRSKEVIGELLGFLDDYTKQHFRDEEAYMKKIGYPDLDKQVAAHKHFVEQLAKLKQDYESSGGSLTVIINANQMVLSWLTQHISNMDKQIGVYVKNMK
ncbi:MAG: hemerythrin family protein [Clostridiales bacterium]|nr:hemerythrin family protein [Clostridiales bacterium]